MGRFKSINYSRVVCEMCNAETVIEPGIVFESLNCKCDTDEAKQLKEIKLYINKDGEAVELIGVFSNGDAEVKYPDGNKAYRIPKVTFKRDFMEKQDADINTQMDDVSQERDPSNTKVEISLLDIKGKSIEDIKKEFIVDELRVLAKKVGIRQYFNMKETKLATKLLEAAEKAE